MIQIDGAHNLRVWMGLVEDKGGIGLVGVCQARTGDNISVRSVQGETILGQLWQSLPHTYEIGE